MTVPVKVRKIGNSLGILIPKDVSEQLGVREGDALYMTVEGGNGVRLTPYDPHFAAALEAFERTRRKYRNALRELAK